jgi:hypothetical protein
MSDYTPEEAQKISQTLGRIKELYKDKNIDEKENIYKVFAEILEDPYYKENMSHYFRKFLTDKY